jgi:antitoxin CptB
MAAGPGGEGDPRRARLAWQCRRGMLELDYLLRDFLETAYGDLDEAGRGAFAALLDCPDPFLYEWLLGQGAPADPALQGIVRRIRRGTPAP